MCAISASTSVGLDLESGTFIGQDNRFPPGNAGRRPRRRPRPGCFRCQSSICACRCVALGQQRLVHRHQVADQLGQSLPEDIGGDACPGKHFLVHKVVQQGDDAQWADFQSAVDSCRPVYSRGMPDFMIPPWGTDARFGVTAAAAWKG